MLIAPATVTEPPPLPKKKSVRVMKNRSGNEWPYSNGVHKFFVILSWSIVTTTLTRRQDLDAGYDGIRIRKTEQSQTADSGRPYSLEVVPKVARDIRNAYISLILVETLEGRRGDQWKDMGADGENIESEIEGWDVSV
jgi:hypothetical protein